MRIEGVNGVFVVFSLPQQKEGPGTSTPVNELEQDIMEGRVGKGGLSAYQSRKVRHAAIVHEFMVMLSVCHTVIPEKINESIAYHAASPGT